MGENRASRPRKIKLSLFITPVTDEIGASKTGSWRTIKPLWEKELCKPCNTCIQFCPDGVISFIDKMIKIDYGYCKGCGICAFECPQQAIKMVEETWGAKSVS